MKTKTKRQTPVRAACRPEVWRAGAVALRKAVVIRGADDEERRMTALRDPELCPKCGKKGRVIESKKRRAGYRRRLHRCGACRFSWPSYQTTIDPRRISAA